MKVLELFAGSRSFSKVAEKHGFETYSTDRKLFYGINYVCDIFDFHVVEVPFIPDIIWASPPCTTFSVASIGKHWDGGHRAYIPKTKEAKIGKKIVQKTWEIIMHFKEKNPDLKYIIENPRGLLRKLDIIPHQPKTAWYCQYGDKRAKPTDLWFNFNWTPKRCRNDRHPEFLYLFENFKCEHENAPRGSKTGTQGLKNDYERSKVPELLCEEAISKIKDRK